MDFILWLVCRLVVQAISDMNVNEDKLSSSPGHFGDLSLTPGHVRNLSLHLSKEHTLAILFIFLRIKVSRGCLNTQKIIFKLWIISCIRGSLSMHL